MIWSRTHILFYPVLSDIVHRDLKLENILVKKLPDATNPEDKLQIKVSSVMSQMSLDKYFTDVNQHYFSCPYKKTIFLGVHLITHEHTYNIMTLEFSSSE